jgi:pimeloyl-ACP methyl ester carboxylesterase
VFFHGLGAPFPPLLRDLRAVGGGGRPVLLLQAKHLSQCFHWRAPSADDIARATAALLRTLGYAGAIFMGHSYGTFYVARTCQLYPQASTAGRPWQGSFQGMQPGCMLSARGGAFTRGERFSCSRKTGKEGCSDMLFKRDSSQGC